MDTPIPSKTWELSLRELHKTPQEAITENTEVAVLRHSLHRDLMCPICLDMLKNTMAAKECLHRFCSECIITALRSGNKECPTCRKKLVSKRSLRPDPNLDDLISKVYPSADECEDSNLVNIAGDYRGFSVPARPALSGIYDFPTINAASSLQASSVDEPVYAGASVNQPKPFAAISVVPSHTISSAVSIAEDSEIVVQASDYAVVKAMSADTADTSEGIAKRKKTTVKSNAKTIPSYLRCKASESLVTVTSIATLTEKDLRPDTEAAPEVETPKQKKQKQSDGVDVVTSRVKTTLSSAKARFPCDLCDRDYARGDKLREHRRCHTGDRPYNCSYCDRSFFRRDKCIIHERWHTGERPYQCDYCDADFTRKDKYRHHVVHTHLRGSKRTVEKEAQDISQKKKDTVTTEKTLETDKVLKTRR